MSDFGGPPDLEPASWRVTHERGENRWTGFSDPEVAAYYEPPVILSKLPDRKTPRAVGIILVAVVVFLGVGLIGGDGVAVPVAPTTTTTSTTLPMGFTS